jgi:hypothetical protein
VTARSRQELAPGEPPPLFAGEATTGRFDLAAYLGQRPVVLLFLPDVTDPLCADYAKAFVSDAAHYRALNAVVVIITISTLGGRELPGVPVVAHAGEVFGHYGLTQDGPPKSAVVIVDRYGLVHAAYVRAACSDLPEEGRVARVLLGAESVCPECGVAEKHWREAVE